MVPNVNIFTKRPVVMQRLMDAVGNGYSRYCCGTFSIDRCEKLVRKYEINYAVLADRNERARRKRANLGNAFLILWLHNGVIHWWLMVTAPDAGDHAAHSTEKLLDANKVEQCIEVEGFELVRLPKRVINTPKVNEKNVCPAEEGNKSYVIKNTRLTWRMNEYKYQAWRDSIVESVRGSSTRSLVVLIYQLWSNPGFSGIRSQTGKIAALYRNEVRRTSRKDAPALPKRLGYVRRLKNQGITLAQLVEQSKTLPVT
jgi:hypothetical protein